MTQCYSDINFLRLMLVIYFLGALIEFDLLIILDEMVAGDELPP